ncbi:HTH domain-containing protein [Meinhardsimonia xiamenensis]|jgi:predicted DNA-binding transcriptional regulator YafY|uniref:HTH domain-containing protein n=1 Tax=Meinhardsimonia xiamenensis TaxID=990712 RepID=A0A1G9APB1_9RHOB|nr:YafY family protein [Meinhardsimonia xiamenensis]PRX35323.1 HTH domain-containing protein [Meinhardsimonia xiamenensis]SDK28395.1 HTH domain-containing protein [Meinhardsimonia xiamenensis]
MTSESPVTTRPGRRADRLIALIAIMRDGRLHRGADLARRLGVSTRTIWRDMEALMRSGVPVAGERGIGYRMTAPVTLPPLNLTLTELEALHLGLAAVSAAADDDELRGAARSLAAKLDAVLPEEHDAPASGWNFAIHPFADAAPGFRHLPRLRAAIRSRQKLAIEHRALDGRDSARVIRPLELDYWGRVWTVTAWCETARDFRIFRADRILSVRALPALFVEEQGKTLADFRARREAGTAAGVEEGL